MRGQQAPDRLDPSSEQLPTPPDPPRSGSYSVPSASATPRPAETRERRECCDNPEPLRAACGGQQPCRPGDLDGDSSARLNTRSHEACGVGDPSIAMPAVMV